MKKALSFCLLSIGAELFLPNFLSACAPGFPPSYYNLAGDTGDYAYYYEQIQIHPDLIGEMKLIGEHYYPEWCNRDIHENTIKSADANRLDFLAAAAAKGLDKEATEEAWKQFETFYSACEKYTSQVRQKASNSVVDKVPQLPESIDEFQEFYLYTYGLLEINLDEKNTFPAAWQSLLELPPEDRHYRTTWVKYMQVILAKNFSDTDVALTDFRKTLDAGFADTLALEAAVIRKLVRRDPETGLRYYPLALVALERNAEFQKNLRDDFGIWSKPYWLEKHPKLFFSLLTDKVGREIATVLKPEMVVSMIFPAVEETAILTADRQAWRLFESGNLELSRELLALAPEDSLIRLFLEARFARIDGDYEKSAVFLRRFLAVYQKSGNLPAGFTGKDVNLAQYVNGMLGVVRVQCGDFQEALYGFLEGNSWFDAAIVAENYLTTDALKEFVDSHPHINQINHLKYLLARRLMREYRPREAGQYFEGEEIEKAYHRYIQLSEQANDYESSQNERALALFHLAILMERYGDSLFDSEELLMPDCPDTSHTVDFLLPAHWGQDASTKYNDFLCQNIPQKIQPQHHERIRAAAFAQRAAQIADDQDLVIASLWMGMFVSRRQDPLCAEGFYRSLCDQFPHSAAKQAIEAKWLPKPVLKRYLTVFEDRLRTLTLEEVKSMVQELSNQLGKPQETERENPDHSPSTTS